MVIKLKQFIVGKWSGFDWHQRTIIAGSIFLLSALIIAASSYSYMNGRVSGRLALERAGVLSAWLVDRNREALVEDRPELADIDTVLKQPRVREAVIFDADGNVFAPLSMRGGRFDDERIFNKVLNIGSGALSLKSNDGLEIFRPIVGADPSISSKNIYGVAYLNLGEFRAIGLSYVVMPVVLVAALFFLFVYWVIRETLRSVRSVAKDRHDKKFDILRDVLKRRVDLSAKEISRSLESEWRKLIHAVSEPVIVLDNHCRLMEMNEAALARFENGKDITEGRHIVDILENDEWQGPIVEMLGDLEKKPRNFVRSKDCDPMISIFSSGSELVDFKYTIVCSEGGGVL